MTCQQFGALGLALQTVQRHFPLGAAWQGVRNPATLIYRLVKTAADAFDDMTAALCAMIGEVDPRTTSQLIGEWEAALSLPDPCLPVATTLEQRRQWVMWRLDKRRYSTAADWHYLASLFGLEIQITPGWLVQKPALYPADYPKRYDLFPKLGRFRVYINVQNLPPCGYDYGEADRGDGYPIPYGCTTADYDQFKCLIARVKPANVVVIWDEQIDV